MTDPRQEQIEKLKAMALKRCSDRITEARAREERGQKMFNPVPHCGITSFLKRNHGL